MAPHRTAPFPKPPGSVIIPGTPCCHSERRFLHGAPNQREDVIRKTLAHYEILDRIGSGGMGEVYRARDSKLGRDVAIKILPPSMADNADRLARFEQEARAASALNHPNLVTVYELGTHEGSPYIVMELLEGQTLREKLGDTAHVPSSGTKTGGVNGWGSTPSTSGTILPIRKAIDYAVQLAHGLAAAHDKGIMHRDLKPENVLITNDGRAKILDFGLAKLNEPADESMTVATPRHGETEPGTVLGTVGYMSPEQVRGEVVDHRSDIFSLGVILYEMLSGRRAFLAESSVQTMNAILTEDVPTLSGEGSRISPPVDRVVRRCLEKQREERFQSGHDLAYALEAVGESSAGLPTLASRSPSEVRRPLLMGAVAIVLVVAAFFAGRSRIPPSSSGSTGSVAGKQPRVLALTFDEGREEQPNLSPDGRSFVYVSNEETGNLNIYFRRVGGETAINLTADSREDDSQPAFSPDGERIAFRSDRGDGGIYVMGATGESVRRLTDFGYNPAWSPDGEDLVVAGESIFDPFTRLTLSSLWRVRVATGDTSRIATGDAVQPNWSSSGRWIAYWGLPEGTGNRALYTVSPHGGEPNLLVNDGTFNWNPVWSGDERFLYFSSTRSGTMDLWRLPMDPATGTAVGDPEPVTLSSEMSGWLSLSGDGNRIIYSSRRETRTLSVARMDPRSPGSTSDPRVLIKTSRFMNLVGPSSQNDRLLLRVSDPDEDLLVCRADGTGRARITNDPFKDRNPLWSPDGNTIFFFSDRTGHYDIWSIRSDGSGLTQITETTGDGIVTSAVSPDGRWLAVLAMQSGGMSSALIDLERTLPIRELEWLPAIDSTKTFLALQFSGDGTRISGLGIPEGDLVVYTKEARSYRRFPDVVPQGAGLPSNGVWLPDDRRLFYAVQDTFFTVDTQSGEIQRQLEDSEVFRDVTWVPSRDFTSMYLMHTETESDIWMLDYGADKGP